MTVDRVDVLVHGAGAIGLFIGGSLAMTGLRVHFVGRPALVKALRENGLTAITLDGRRRLVSPERSAASDSIAAAPVADLVLLTVKGTGTVNAARELQLHCAARTPVISFQNGVDNIDRLVEAAPDLQAIAGMVPFNVVIEAPGVVRQTTSGGLAAADHEVTRRWLPHFAKAGLPLKLATDMRAVQWGKLLLNLNNPINALAGVPLLQQLLDRDYRLVLAQLQHEALLALRAAGIEPARATPLPPRWIPRLLRLPTPVFRLLAQRMLTIHPKARSSMFDDRVNGRPTEIDDLCGAVIRLAESQGIRTPTHRLLRELVVGAGKGEFLSAPKLRTLLGV